MVKVFDHVICDAYLKKVKDGVCIGIFGKDGLLIQDTSVRDHKVASLVDQDGKAMEVGDSVRKTYYEISNKIFHGVVVGFKDIIVKADIVIDYEEPYYGDAYFYCRRENKEIIKCAIVYFGNNLKRFVPIEHIKECKEWKN